MFKILNYLNYVFVAFPLLILLTTFGDEDTYSLTGIATLCTGIFQLFVAISWLIIEPEIKN